MLKLNLSILNNRHLCGWQLFFVGKISKSVGGQEVKFSGLTVVGEKDPNLVILNNKALGAYRSHFKRVRIIESDTRKLGYAEGRYLTEAKFTAGGVYYSSHIEWFLDFTGRGYGKFFIWQRNESKPLTFTREVRAQKQNRGLLRNRKLA